MGLGTNLIMQLISIFCHVVKGYWFCKFQLLTISSSKVKPHSLCLNSILGRALDRNLCVNIKYSNLLSVNPTKWLNTLSQLIGNSQRIVWICLTILWGWRLKYIWKLCKHLSWFQQLFGCVIDDNTKKDETELHV